MNSTCPRLPTLLYYGDFERSGRMRLVEAEFEDDTLFPVRGKSCSTNAMPFLGNKYHKFHDFAIASLQDIYTPDRLESAHRFAANSLESGLLRNDGSGQFEFVRFPTIAQAAPVFGMVVTEVDGDGRPDVVLTQNFYGPQPETGRADGGVGLVLLGNGDGTFEPMSPSRSGIVVPGDATAACLADVNADGRDDLLIATNDGPCHVFSLREPRSVGRTLRLIGQPPNVKAIGARLMIDYHNGTTIAREVTAGGGYLSQSDTRLSTGEFEGSIKRIEVAWPNGETSVLEPVQDDNDVTIVQPES